jgi:hypothetical protein
MMETASTASVSRKAFWTGWVLSALPALLLLVSGLMKVARPKVVLEGFTHLGWPDGYAMGIGLMEIGCVIVYLIPQTAVLGAILIAGYMGGAIATHVRIGEMFIVPQIACGILAWLGVYLREPRLRKLAPLRT